MMITRTALLATAFFLLAACDMGRGADVAAAGGVGMSEIPLAQLVPAIAAPDVEQGRCDVSHRQPSGVGVVRMSWPSTAGETWNATVMLDPSGQPTTYSEMRRSVAGMTSIVINVPEGSGGATNVTEAGARMTIGRGTADEALRSEALGVPARRMERILARCGRPGATS